eukprot:263252-Alexandrium_andersonii.AAC.1
MVAACVVALALWLHPFGFPTWPSSSAPSTSQNASSAWSSSAVLASSASASFTSSTGAPPAV